MLIRRLWKDGGMEPRSGTACAFHASWSAHMPRRAMCHMRCIRTSVCCALLRPFLDWSRLPSAMRPPATCLIASISISRPCHRSCFHPASVRNNEIIILIHYLYIFIAPLLVRPKNEYRRGVSPSESIRLIPFEFEIAEK